MKDPRFKVGCLAMSIMRQWLSAFLLTSIASLLNQAVESLVNVVSRMEQPVQGDALLVSLVLYAGRAVSICYNCRLQLIKGIRSLAV